MATYVGYTVAGIPGGIVATFSLVLPSVTIALIVAQLMVRFRESSLVQAALYGLRPASLGLISAVGIAVFCLAVFGVELRDMVSEHFILFDYRALILAAVLFIVTNVFKKLHPIIFLVASAFIGIFLF